MKINQNIYPYNTEVRKLPIHLTGIGGSEYQYHVVRAEGYHWHQILFSASGSGFLKYDNITKPVEEGDFFFLPAGYPHEYYSEKPEWEVRWVAFDGYASAHILSRFSMTVPVIVRSRENSALEKIYNKMFTAQKTDRAYGDYSCSGLIYEYIIEFHRLMDTKLNKLRTERSKILEPVLDYIDENYRTDFPLTVLAELAGITPQHLCRVFKEAMNMRPIEYLTHRRLQEAKRLLQQSELSVAEAAVQSGFPDAGYFSTVFKKKEGMTPLEYKKSTGSL
ncbi:MAG: helix-turn-helix transcriptional regulator [Oscillospiraceae bacterium]|nr:helix-turn-helix transcriptional regulator [Oscillospiraceae bacterium]